MHDLYPKLSILDVSLSMCILYKLIANSIDNIYGSKKNVLNVMALPLAVVRLSMRILLAGQWAEINLQLFTFNNFRGL